MSDEHTMGHVGYSPDFRARRELNRTIAKAMKKAIPAHFRDCVEICEGQSGSTVLQRGSVTCTWCRGWMVGKGIATPIADPSQQQLFEAV